MKRISLIMAASILILTGCASPDTDDEKTPVFPEAISYAHNPQTPEDGPESGIPDAEAGSDDKTVPDDTQAPAAQGGTKASQAPGVQNGTKASQTPTAQGGSEASQDPTAQGGNEVASETLTGPPVLTVSTLNYVDSVVASCGNYHWSHSLADGTATVLLACGAHPLDCQEHPILYTAFPGGTLPAPEEGAHLSSILPIYYLDFGHVPPETVSVIRWPASYIGDTQGHSTDFEAVPAESDGGIITLMPLGDGEFVYEVSAEWGDTGGASYVFRTLPQVRGSQETKQAGLFAALEALEYQPYTCDGLPECRLYAADGTVYAINFSEKWVWRGNVEEAELTDELIALLQENKDLLRTEDKPLEMP